MPDRNYYTQPAMEKACREMIEAMPENEKGNLDALLEPRFERCDAQKRTLTLSFLCKDWMCNPVMNMHGGIIASAFDITMGVICCYMCGFEVMTPTVSINIDYLRSIPCGSRLVVTSEITHLGRTLIQLTARAVLENEPDRLAATASSTYYIVRKSPVEKG